MHCNCGNNQEMVRRQHELRIYLECTACGRIHWIDKMAESAKKPKVQDSPENVPDTLFSVTDRYIRGKS